MPDKTINLGTLDNAEAQFTIDDDGNLEVTLTTDTLEMADITMTALAAVGADAIEDNDGTDRLENNATETLVNDDAGNAALEGSDGNYNRLYARSGMPAQVRDAVGGLTAAAYTPGPSAPNTWDWGGHDMTNINSVDTDELSASAEAPTQLTQDGAWCWFQGPRAVRHVGNSDKTYIGWVNSDGDIEVAEYDHANGSTSTTTLSAGLNADDHASPSILIRNSDERVVVFYSAHNGENIYYRESTDAEDVSSFDAEQSLSPSEDHTYMNPVQLSENGRIYLFYRNGSDDLAYVFSDDDAASWSSEATAVSSSAGSIVYFRIGSNDTDRIDVALTRAEGSQSEPKTDVRHVYLSGGDFHESDGTVLGSSIGFTDATVVYDSSAEGNHSAWVWDCATHDEDPEIAYATFPDYDDHNYRFARWGGAAWQDNRVGNAGSFITTGLYNEEYYSPGIALDHDTPGRAFAAVGDHRSSNLLRVETDDAGDTWSVSEVASANQQNVRPVVPRNAADDIPVLWMRGSYNYFKDGGYQTGIVGGDGAPFAGASGSYRHGGSRAHLDSDFAHNQSDSFVTVPFDSTNFDMREEFDTTNNEFVASRTGMYYISATVGFNALPGPGKVVAEIRQNGESQRTEFGRQEGLESGALASLNGSIVARVNKGDTISVAAYHDTGDEVIIESLDRRSQLSVVQIS